MKNSVVKGVVVPHTAGDYLDLMAGIRGRCEAIGVGLLGCAVYMPILSRGGEDVIGVTQMINKRGGGRDKEQKAAGTYFVFDKEDD